MLNYGKFAGLRLPGVVAWMHSRTGINWLPLNPLHNTVCTFAAPPNTISRLLSFKFEDRSAAMCAMSGGRWPWTHSHPREGGGRGESRGHRLLRPRVRGGGGSGSGKRRQRTDERGHRAAAALSFLRSDLSIAGARPSFRLFASSWPSPEPNVSSHYSGMRWLTPHSLDDAKKREGRLSRPSLLSDGQARFGVMPTCSFLHILFKP